MLTGYLQQDTKVGMWRKAGAEQVLWEQVRLSGLPKANAQFNNAAENQNLLNSL